MLQVTVPSIELYDEITNRFSYTKEQTLQLEHSLVSLAKWESNWKKSFLSKETKTREESIDYIRCMTLTQNVDPMIYEFMPSEVIEKVNKYIEDPMTATTFSKSNMENREVITAEIIYYWMILYNIPVDFQKWHLNRLLTLIRVCNIKNSPQKKMSKADIAAKYRALNSARRNNLNSRG